MCSYQLCQIISRFVAQGEFIPGLFNENLKSSSKQRIIIIPDHYSRGFFRKVLKRIVRGLYLMTSYAVGGYHVRGMERAYQYILTGRIIIKFGYKKPFLRRREKLVIYGFFQRVAVGLAKLETFRIVIDCQAQAIEPGFLGQH